MAKFIIPKIKTVPAHIGDYNNHPVNIDLCTEICSKIYTDGYGNIYPSIEFIGINCIWIYPKDGTEIRDNQYDEILNQYS